MLVHRYTVDSFWQVQRFPLFSAIGRLLWDLVFSHIVPSHNSLFVPNKLPVRTPTRVIHWVYSIGRKLSLLNGNGEYSVVPEMLRLSS